MNPSKQLILKDGQDVTIDVKLCKYNPETKKYDVTFQNGKTYACGYQSIEWVKDPETLNPALVHIRHRTHELFNIQSICVFHARYLDYWHICFSNGTERTYSKSDLQIEVSCLSETKAKNCIDYLRQLAAINELKSEDGEILLQKQYEKLDFVGADTAMASYLNPAEQKLSAYRNDNLIFPFGGNASQFKAVENALDNQISIIQGPPGTGKTQTILNIIANLLANGKTVQVVSTNNSATANVLEKLASQQCNLGFLAAPLGNASNKKAFIQNQTGLNADLSKWERNNEKQTELKREIKNHTEGLADIFAKQEQFAKARALLDALLREIEYFKLYRSETGLEITKVKHRQSIKSKTLMQLWQECLAFFEHDREISLWFKIKSVFIYGISDWNFYKTSLPSIITMLQGLFYQSRQAELNEEITTLEKYLANSDAKLKIDELTSLSMEYLRSKLYEQYGNKSERTIFSEEDLWRNPGEVLKEYPIVLSTTFSSRSCLQGATYDYIIMDEASQVDIATGALALSSARNAVIVGDLKQLPNVIKDEMKKRSDAVYKSYNLPDGYSFSENSFIKSICSVLPDAPQTLLREHYRCHPKIIGFCNQKFYNNNLIIMTEDKGETDTLSVIKTSVGNHQRDRINQRQIDVITQEVLPMFKNTKSESIGIIAPYRDQVKAITNQLFDNQIEVHTVHKFQGREKDIILLSSVDDVVSDFSDDPYLLNVAVSRAKSRLCLVVSGNEQPNDSNIGDLIAYIEYNNFQVLQSSIYSVFDLLYRQYTEARIAYLKKRQHISQYDSENLMYVAIVEILDKRPHLSLNVICHQPLNMLIRDPKYLNDVECQYAMNTATHLDFLIYNQISKKPVLAIEVDGFHFHKPGTAQYERDRMKDRILSLYNIPLLRFATNGSNEIAQVEQALDGYGLSRFL